LCSPFLTSTRLSAFIATRSGSNSWPTGVTTTAASCSFQRARATLELFDQAQAAKVDAIEAGRRVSGTVRLALEVADNAETARRLVAAGAEEVAQPVVTPWGDRNARVQAPDGMQLTLFTPSPDGTESVS
jgi:uncharacterized glyoxalase superfamily protein PhnB